MTYANIRYLIINIIFLEPKNFSQQAYKFYACKIISVLMQII